MNDKRPKKSKPNADDTAKLSDTGRDAELALAGDTAELAPGELALAGDTGRDAELASRDAELAAELALAGDTGRAAAEDAASGARPRKAVPSRPKTLAEQAALERDLAVADELLQEIAGDQGFDLQAARQRTLERGRLQFLASQASLAKQAKDLEDKRVSAELRPELVHVAAELAELVDERPDVADERPELAHVADERPGLAHVGEALGVKRVRLRRVGEDFLPSPR